MKPLTLNLNVTVTYCPLAASVTFAACLSIEAPNLSLDPIQIIYFSVAKLLALN